MKKVILTGFLGRDLEKTAIGSYTTLKKTSIAVTSKRKKEEITTWFNLNFWDDRVKGTSFLKKGSFVTVMGTLDFHTYLNKSGEPSVSLDVSVDTFSFVPGTSKKEDSQKEPSLKDEIIPEEETKEARSQGTWADWEDKNGDFDSLEIPF